MKSTVVVGDRDRSSDLGDRRQGGLLSWAARHRTAGLLLAACLLTACDAATEPPKPQLSPEAIALRDASPELVFKGVLAGKPVHLLVHDCEVFQIAGDPQGQVTWTRVLRTDPYPFAFCERQSLVHKDSAVIVTLGRRAFGSGGCCAVGGTYRTTDGWTWKEQ